MIETSKEIVTEVDLNSEAFVNWKNSECTKQFLGWMRGQREDMKDVLLLSAFRGDNAHQDACNAARTQGMAEMCHRIVTVIEDIHIPMPNLEEENGE